MHLTVLYVRSVLVPALVLVLRAVHPLVATLGRDHILVPSAVTDPTRSGNRKHCHKEECDTQARIRGRAKAEADTGPNDKVSIDY